MKLFVIGTVVWACVASLLLVAHDLQMATLVARQDSLARVVTAWIERRPPRSLKAERDSIVVQAAREVGVPAHVALGVAWVENPRADSLAVSRVGALGLMQVMPPDALAARGDTAGALVRATYIIDVCGLAHSLLERECNVRVGMHLYRDFLDHYKDEGRALAAYNGALQYPGAARRYITAVRTYARALQVVGSAQ